MKVWLDDRREAPAGWVRVDSPSAVIDLLRCRNVEEISLDHDLGLVDEQGWEITGYDVLTWIERELAMGSASFKVPTIHIHSANAAVYKRMEQARDAIERLASRR